MNKDVIIVIGFVIVVIILCKLWNTIVLNKYDKSRIINNKIIKFGAYMDSFEKLELLGVGSDENSDFEFTQAVKKIDFPDDIRIKIYD